MANQELISVIVPIYNVEKYLKKCIDSIINQTYKNLEIILVDDGSPDNCGKICDEYAKNDKRIKVIHKKNGGLSDARNAGIDIAKGKYIGFVDSDDYIVSDMYEYLYNILIENSSDISICDYEYYYEKNNIIGKSNNVKINETVDKKEALRRLMGNSIGNYAWNKLYKRDLFNDVRYPVGKKMEDCGTTYKLFYLSNKITIGNERKYYYLQRDDSILHKKNFSFYKDFFELTLEKYKFIKEKYPEIIENDIDMVNKILTLYFEQSEGMEKYIETYNDELMSLFNQITTDKNFKKSINMKMRVKLALFKANKKLFIKISQRKYNKKENKKNLKDILFIIKLKARYFKHELSRNVKCTLKNEKLYLDKDKKRTFVFLAADYGNIGDIAITYAQKEFLKDCLKNYQIIEINLHDTYKYLYFLKKNINKDDIITIIGGGNLTNRYDYFEELRRIVIKNFKNNKIISFPQTIEFTEDYFGQISKRRSQKIYSKNRNLIIFAREKKSFENMKETFPKNKVLLCPDIVMYLKEKLNIKKDKREKIGICLRDDKEKAINSDIVKEKIIKKCGKENIIYMSTHTGDENYRQEKRDKYFKDLLENISQKEFFVTDRLHGMIFCYLTNTPCLAFDNDNHKVKETYDLWLKDCEFIKLVSNNEINDIDKFIEEIKTIKINNINLKDKFDNLKKAIMER